MIEIWKNLNATFTQNTTMNEQNLSKDVKLLSMRDLQLFVDNMVHWTQG